MSTIIVAGASWGDEGKGKIIDILAEKADTVVRYSGGPNAGHTLVVGDKKVIVRLIPSGILRPNTTCILGQGMVIDLERLFLEIDELISQGHDVSNLHISDKAHVILSWHKQVDALRESGVNGIGTTKRGVGPCYEDKTGRRGVRIGDLKDSLVLKNNLDKSFAFWSDVLSIDGQIPKASHLEKAALMKYAERLLPMICETSYLVNADIDMGKHVLLEGAQGTLLDIDHGTYPYVTSSNAITGGACTGAGVGPTKIDFALGLIKAYTTRVGEGPFPTELNDDDGQKLRDVGHEYGSVTGRPRRCGWLDLPALNYAIMINGFDGLALTKLDVLSEFDTIKICIGYKTSTGYTEEFPLDELATATPVYKEFKGWRKDISKCKVMIELPSEALEYLDFIKENIKSQIIIVSVGPERDETIIIDDPFVGIDKNKKMMRESVR